MDLKKEINYARLLMNRTEVGQSVYQNFDKMMYLGGDNFRGLFSNLEMVPSCWVLLCVGVFSFVLSVCCCCLVGDF